jgi:hypothetical protein
MRRLARIAVGVVAVAAPLQLALAGTAGATSVSYPATEACNSQTNNGICISEVNVGYTPSTVTLSDDVGQATDPTTDPNWFSTYTPSVIGWLIYEDGETAYSYEVVAGDSGSPGQFIGGVSTSGDALTSVSPTVTATYDTAANTYGVSFPASCIGDPSSFSVVAEWLYSDYSNGIQYSASEPGVGSGTCCTVTPTTPTPAPAPTPTPTPTPVSAPIVSTALAAPVVGMAATPDGGGYWLTDALGDVSAHGDATLYGSLAGDPLNAPITHIVATPDGKGYWLVAADGGTFTFGDAHFYGSMGGKPLNAPVVDIAPTADGGGYWLVASDGGIFAFGDAKFLGSMGGQHLNKPVVGMAPVSDGSGYRLVASDGGVFDFNAPFYGSTGSMHLNAPIVAGLNNNSYDGYWLTAADGGVFTFSPPNEGMPFYGSAA